MENELRLVTLS